MSIETILSSSTGIIYLIIFALILNVFQRAVMGVFRIKSRNFLHLYRHLLRDSLVILKVIAHPVFEVKSVPSNYDEITEPETRVILQKWFLNTSNIRIIEEMTPSTFVDVFFDVIIQNIDEKLFEHIDAVVSSIPDDNLKAEIVNIRQDIILTGYGSERLLLWIEKLPQSPLKEKLLEAFSKTFDTYDNKLVGRNNNLILSSSFEQLQNDELTRLLRTLLRRTNSLDEARSILEQWYQDNVDRMSKNIRRQGARIHFVLAFILVIIFNVDAFWIVETLINSAVFEQVTEMKIENLDSSLVQCEERIDPSAVDILNSDEATVIGDYTDCETDYDAELGSILSDSTQDRLPIFWELTDLSAYNYFGYEHSKLRNRRYLWNMIPGNNQNWLWLLSNKIAGLIVSILILSIPQSDFFAFIPRLRS